jgi:hypothetical protein
MLRRPVTFIVALIFAIAASGFSMVLLLLGQPKLPSCAFDQEPRQRRRPTSPPNRLFEIRPDRHLRAPSRSFKYKSKVAGRPFAFHQLDFVQESEAEEVDSETHSADDEMDYPSKEEVEENGRTRSEEGLKQDNHKADLSNISLGARGRGEGKGKEERKAKNMSDCALFRRRRPNPTFLTARGSSSQPQPYSPFSAPPEWLSPTSSAASPNWIKKLFKSTKSTFKSKKSRSRSSSDSSNVSSISFGRGEETL